MCCSSILLETFPLHNGGLFPLCNRSFPLHSLCYLLQPYPHHHPDFDLASTSPPSILLLLPTHIHQIPPSTTSMGDYLYHSRYPLRKSDLDLNHSSEVPIQKATLSLSIARPPPEPPPHVKQLSAFGPMDLLPPSTQQLVFVPHPSSLLSRVRPPRKPPDKSGKLYGFSLPVRILFVFVQVFWCVRGFQAVKVKIAHYVFVGMSLQRWVMWKTKIWLGPYCVVISFCNLFMFWLSFYFLIKVEIIETTCNRNVLAAVAILIRNWIDKKIVDSLLFVVMDQKIFQCREFGFRRWFSGNISAFSQSLASVDLVLVGPNVSNFLFVCFLRCFVCCVMFLCLVGCKSLYHLRLMCWYPTSFIVLYKDESRFTAFALYQLVFVQNDKVKKSETKCSRNERDVVEKMIRNWIDKKTLDSHISFVRHRRWKLLMVWLLEYEIWLKSSYWSAKFLGIANHALVVFFSCIGSLKLLGNTPSILTLAVCNILYFMQ